MLIFFKSNKCKGECTLKNNKSEIKSYIKNNNLYQWQVAEFLGIDETKLSKLFRKELSEKDMESIKNAVDCLVKNEVASYGN